MVLLLFSVSSAARAYENDQFSINSIGKVQYDSSRRMLIMLMPASDGFSPSINVSVKEYPDSLRSFAEMTEGQFEQMGFEKIQHRLLADKLIFEYTGKIQGRLLHWYAVAHKKGDKMFVVTATAAESQWQNVSGKLLSCVRSFRLK
jgi:hypothetical protein